MNRKPGSSRPEGSRERVNGNNHSQRFFGVQWRLLLTHLEVALGAVILGGLMVGVPLYRDEPLGRSVLLGALAAVIALTGGAAIGLRFSRGLKLRLREAGRFASALARGEYRSRIRPGTPDEIGRLEDDLNSMAENLEIAVGELRALAERNRRLAEEAGCLAALEERAQLARDLHDTVNQQVFSLSMQAAAARRRLEAARGDAVAVGEVVRALSEVEDLARSAHQQMRDLILELRPTTLEEQGLGPALSEYARTFTESEGLECHCEIEFEGRFGFAAEEAFFRMAQEALNNVAKHAGAGCVTVSLELNARRRVVMRIKDDGRGFDPSVPPRPTSLGLKGLHERARSIGARVVVDSAPGRGASVTVILPLTRPLPAGRSPEPRVEQPPISRPTPAPDDDPAAGSII